MLCFLACQQIDVSTDRFFSTLRLEVFHHLPILQSYGCGNAFYLFHIYLPVSFGNDLCCCIFDSVDIDGQYAHSAGWNIEFGQFHSAGFESYASLGGDVLQAFIVVDEDECTVALRAV